jgi:uncharacterized metal-binding protein
MVDLPKKKAGIVACSGEELAEGTVSRLAALKVLERLRPGSTVTICLPLFLAGGEGDRAFARFYPTIAIDGCELRCAARATEKYSARPTASVVVRDIVAERGLPPPQGCRRLDAAGLQAVEATASRVAELVDEALGKPWSRRGAQAAEPAAEEAEPVEATCSCGSGIPVTKLTIDGKAVELIALRPILEQFRAAGKPPDATTAAELLNTVKIYNEVPEGAEASTSATLLREYARFCADKEGE